MDFMTTRNNIKNALADWKEKLVEHDQRVARLEALVNSYDENTPEHLYVPTLNVLKKAREQADLIRLNCRALETELKKYSLKPAA